MNQYTGIYRRCELWFIRRELEQFGLQPLEGKIIMFLQDNQCTQEDIGAHFDLDKGRIARNLSELEEKGLVTAYEREAAAGKPRRYYHLTKAGEAALREKETAWHTYADAVGRVLGGGACCAGT